MNYQEIRQLSKDSIFNTLLETSLANIARAVMLEGEGGYTASGLTKRHSQAVLITNDITNQRNRFAIYIASDTAVNSLIETENGVFIYPEPRTALDSVVNNSVSANFNILAGLTYAETQV